MTPLERKKFWSGLGRWFRPNRRMLPWRRTRDPYAILVSEVMLQQTVVAAVVPYFERWMKRFPTVEALAAARETVVLRMWEGLGYYSRARNLLAAARVMAKALGRVPATYEGLRALPGVGDYTASAVLALAFDEPYPVLDANVKRILQRILSAPVFTPRVEKRIRAFLSEGLSRENAAVRAEALMELGELVCRPSSPRCGECPVSRFCAAFRLGNMERIPKKRMRPSVKMTSHVGIFIRSGEVYLERGEGRLMKGLLRFPRYAGAEELERGARRFLGPAIRFVRRLPARLHAYTIHRERLLPVVFASVRKTRRICGFVPLDRLDEYPMPSVYRRMADDLEEI